jgi:hypothetical protein
MNTRESLPGRWVDLRFTPAQETAGLGPALGWLAGALASGGPVWTWPHLGFLFLGMLIIGSAWGRLWTLTHEVVAPVRPASTMDWPEELPPVLPYTDQGSLSARVSQAGAWLWRRLQHLFRVRGDRWIEVIGLLAVLLVVCSLLGRRAFLAAWIGVALLLLRYLARSRPRALALLRVLAGITWPWWVGHVAWASLTGSSLLVSVLWGVAYAGWADLVAERSGSDPFDRPILRPTEPNRRALIATGVAQGGVVLYLLLSGEPVVGGVLVLFLLGQVLLQAGLVRSGRWDEIARRTWPLAAAAMLLTGLVLGGWL